MDQLGKTMNNLSLWEVKSYVRKAQNAVLNLSDVEAKVREATNNEPWGASTTLMQDIARGTFNYRDREEICNMIFRRFTEKSAHEWRQIYKSLQLMEYLVKNGSERFVDDARANVSLVSMLKSFHYIDSKGVDQGINIRNRAKELTNLLNDENKIRQERKKAKENLKKFDAISSTSAGSRNLGRRPSYRNPTANSSRSNTEIDTNDDDGYENRIFGDGGVFGQRFEEARGANMAPGAFEEYDDGDSNQAANHIRRTSKPSVSSSKVNARGNSLSANTNNADLLDFDLAATSNNNDINNEDFEDDEDDDFDDFQSATPATTSTPSNNLNNLLNASYSQSQYQNHTNNNNGFATSTTTAAAPAISQPKKTDDIFGSLLASAQTSATKPMPAKPISKPSYASNNTYTNNSNSNTTTTTTNNNNNNNGGVVDLLDL